MEIRQPLTIDLARPMPMVPVSAVQGDGNTRILEITLLENGAPWQIPEAAVVDVAFRKPDGTKGIYSKLPDGSSATDCSGNVLSATLAPQMLTCPGAVLATVVFRVDGGKTLAAFPFTVTVQASPAAGAQVSEDYFNPTQLGDLRAELAAGLATKAPAGYVSGSYRLSNYDSLDALLTSIYTPMADNSVKMVFIADDIGIDFKGGDLIATIYKNDPDYGVVEFAHYIYQGAEFRKCIYGGVWQPLEWVNPTMVPGVEYRTTERYLGKPVYYQLVSAGNLPNATTRTIDTTELANPIYYILSVHGRTTIQNRTIPLGKHISVRGGYGNITLETTEDYADDEAELVVKYYKPYE